MSILTGLYNFFNFINENWTMIVSIVVVVLAVCKKVDDFFKKSKEEREEIVKSEIDEQVTIAKEQISEIMLKLVTRAEEDYQKWVSAGGIKRAQVINEIFEMYPILSQVTNQQEIIKFLDDTIDIALDKMREVFEKNKSVISEK